MQTVLRIGLSLLGGWALLRLWPEFVLLPFAVVLAVALYPIVTWLERKKVSRGAALGLIALGLLVVIVGLLALVTTSLAEQMSRLIQDFPGFRARVEQRIPASHPILRRIVAEIFALPRSPELASQLQRPLALGTSVLAVALSMLFTRTSPHRRHRPLRDHPNRRE
jgi:predicted PurR-regulated permease PerM